jgi:hypothetical protein
VGGGRVRGVALKHVEVEEAPLEVLVEDVERHLQPRHAAEEA